MSSLSNTAVHLRQNSQSREQVTTWRMTLSGFCASLVGIGVARFAYTPLLPAIIDAHWFAASSGAYLGAANLAGYLAGALFARPALRVIPDVAMIRLMMVVAAVALIACAWPLSFAWFFGWRFVSGLAGGALMVLAAPTVLPHVPANRRGLASGVIFMGVGAGIAASGTLVPLLLRQSLVATWIGLGVFSLALTAVAWNGWPRGGDPRAEARVELQRRSHAVTLRSLYVQYALNAAGLVPHMIFLVDFVARGLGLGVQAGSEYWVLFGLGALFGPVLTGHLADRIGFGPALRLAYLIQALAVLLPAMGWGTSSLMLSSVVVGAFTPGIVPLVLGRIHELLAHHPAEQKAAWSAATTSFAVLQAGSAYFMSYLFARNGGDYSLLFIVGALALGLALAMDLVVAVARRGAR
ncbi:YbfB/YjiJ family MFS transporter [Dyella solisilvae]|uniref:YbfB/YjiJ family MFS transporter n=1 Tax=Dyella solisilvae TaxID=1920168 RepID=A0A370KAC0_9GAMM|nr:YbfB/YjiJ family MFS transporter [Dyella solisilvae]RDI99377.1 YbfB/YjiJ family MFS transporter [Dyella solisilvae]